MLRKSLEIRRHEPVSYIRATRRHYTKPVWFELENEQTVLKSMKRVIHFRIRKYCVHKMYLDERTERLIHTNV